MGQGQEYRPTRVRGGTFLIPQSYALYRDPMISGLGKSEHMLKSLVDAATCGRFHRQGGGFLTDNLTPAQRRRSMRSNTSTGTSPERQVRRLLRLARIRFRAHQKGLPGTPDFVLPAEHTALFVHGCFWHSHHCQPSRLPGTHKNYWEKKLTGNVSRDKKIRCLLRKAGWRPLTLWECQLKKLTVDGLLKKLEEN